MAEMLVAQVRFAALTTWALHASWASHLTRKMRLFSFWQNQSRTEVEMQRSEIQRLREQARSYACIWITYAASHPCHAWNHPWITYA